MMRTFLLLVLLLASACSRHPPADTETAPTGPAERTAVTFTARVQHIAMIDGTTATPFWPMHPDPRYLVTLVVTEAAAPGFPFQPGGTYVLGIHSPAKLLLSESDVGSTVHFTVDWRHTPDGDELTALRRTD